MLLLINLEGVNDPQLAGFYQALRERCREAVIAVGPRGSGEGDGRRGGMPGTRIDPLHRGDLFCFAVDGSMEDLPAIALDVICPERPRLVVIGVVRGRRRSREGLLLALRCADLGLPVLLVEQAGTGGEERPDGAEGPLSGPTADLARTCLGVKPLRGGVLRVRYPEDPAGAAVPPRLGPCSLGEIPHHYRLVRIAEDDSSWQAGARADETADAEGATEPVASVIHLARPHDVEDITEALRARW
jgi:hypothetical protein